MSGIAGGVRGFVSVILGYYGDTGCWCEETAITKRLRVGVGVCVLSTGLFISSSGGAIAWADTDTGSDSSSSSSQGADGQSTGNPVSAPSEHRPDPLGKAVRHAIRGITGTLGSIQNQVEQRSVIIRQPKTSPDTDASGHSVTPAGPNDSDALAPDPDVIATDPGALATSPDPAESASIGSEPSPTTQPIASVPAAAAPTSGGTGAVPAPRPPFVNPFGPIALQATAAVTNVATSVGTAVVSVPGLLLSLPGSQTPVTDVITSLEEMLASVTYSAIPLTQLPADFAEALAAGWYAPSATVGRPDKGLASPTNTLLGLLQPSQSTSATTVSAPRSALSTAEVVGHSTLDATAAATSLSHRFMPAGSVVDTAMTTDTGPSLLEGAVTALLVSVSLWALITAALPGLGGLAAIGATGVRIGYRQAKAGLALRTTELARFAGGGPIGVVRSDSLIVMRPRSMRDLRPEVNDARPELRVLQQIA
jgi:hypothetical protein